MVILTIRERATWVLLLTALIFPLAADAQEQKQHAAQYEQYLQGASRVADHFKALYGELGKHVRRSGVLKKCGYKKEADETDARVKALIDQKLTALIERDIDSRQLSSDVAISSHAKARLACWLVMPWATERALP